MAPELFDESLAPTKEYTSAVDIWALGAVAYCARTGKGPFASISELFSFSTGKTRFPLTPLISSSGAFMDFILNLMDKIPANRLTIDQVLEQEWLKSGGNVAKVAHQYVSKLPEQAIDWTDQIPLGRCCHRRMFGTPRLRRRGTRVLRCLQVKPCVPQLFLDRQLPSPRILLSHTVQNNKHTVIHILYRRQLSRQGPQPNYSLLPTAKRPGGWTLGTMEMRVKNIFARSHPMPSRVPLISQSLLLADQQPSTLILDIMSKSPLNRAARPFTKDRHLQQALRLDLGHSISMRTPT